MQHSQEPFKPSNKLVAWVDQRLPIFTLMQHQLNGFPTPKNLNVAYVFGAILSVVLALQIITGLTLTMHYTTNVTGAFRSVESIMRDVNYGWLLRYLHANGASMFFMAVYLHIFRGLYYGSYKAPREIIWLIGVIIFVVMMATAFMGYVLPWGQMSFWGATVITGLFSAFPIIGDPLVTWLWGGFSVDNATLNRFFALHFLMPFLLIGLVALHIWALHVPGNNNPTGVEVKDKSETVPFHPYYTLKDAFYVLLFMMFYAFWVFYHPNYLGHPDNYIEANPMVTPSHIVPEWYFLPFYAILRSVPDKLFGVLAMFGAIVVLGLVPWLDTSRVKSARYRPLYRQFFKILAVVTVLLGYIGAQTPDASFFGGHVAEGHTPLITNMLVGQLATVYYFVHFLIILPLLGFIEKPEPQPESITAALGGKA